MVTKQQVFAAHDDHPDWTSEEIARHLNCLGAYVRSTARRYGLVLPHKIDRGKTPDNLRGRAAKLQAQANKLLEHAASMEAMPTKSPQVAYTAGAYGQITTTTKN